MARLWSHNNKVDPRDFRQQNLQEKEEALAPLGKQRQRATPHEEPRDAPLMTVTPKRRAWGPISAGRRCHRLNRVSRPKYQQNPVLFPAVINTHYAVVRGNHNCAVRFIM